eukprot:scaffold7386_cov255-Pinguiococcus_pyrenoidosus.AAC.3
MRAMRDWPGKEGSSFRPFDTQPSHALGRTSSGSRLPASLGGIRIRRMVRTHLCSSTHAPRSQTRPTKEGLFGALLDPVATGSDLQDHAWLLDDAADIGRRFTWLAVEEDGGGATQVRSTRRLRTIATTARVADRSP